MTKSRKISIEKIEKNEYRKVTFTKRRNGLFSKAKEFCNLFESEIAVVTFSSAGKPFSFGHPSVDSVIDGFLDKDASSNMPSSTTSLSSSTMSLSSSSKDLAEKEAGHLWWALDLDGLKKYKAYLEHLKNDVANQLEEVKDRKARTRDFIELLNA